MNTLNFKTVNVGGLTSDKNKLTILLLTLFAMLLLFSCRKTAAELPGQDTPARTSIDESAESLANNSVESVPYERTFFVPCANSGIGEDVLLTGTIKIVEQVIFNNNRFTMTYNTNAQGLTGVGLSTGETYRASGGSPGTITGSLENDQFTGFYIEQLRITSQNSTYLVNYRFHVTITSDGVIITQISEDNVDCK